MRSSYKILLATLPMMLLIGCGGGSSETNTGTETTTGTNTANILAYEGTWLGHCFDNGDKSSQTTLKINSGAQSGTYTVKQHDGSFCGSVEDVISMVEVDIEYPASHTSSVCANASQVNLTIKPPILITDNTNGGATTSFTLEQFEAIIAASGQTLSTYIKLFDIVCSSDDGLQLYGGKPGLPNDGSTSDKRPTELSIQFPFLKQ